MSNELLYNQLYERTKDFGRSQFVREIMRLERENKELKNKIDKAIEFIEDYGHGYDCTGDVYYCLDEENQKELLEILKDSNVNE